MTSFLCQLNGLNILSDRFNLCHRDPVESIKENSEAYTIADAKVLFCNYSCEKMDKGYDLFIFKIQEPLSQEEFSFIKDFRIGKLDNPLIKGNLSILLSVIIHLILRLTLSVILTKWSFF